MCAGRLVLEAEFEVVKGRITTSKPQQSKVKKNVMRAVISVCKSIAHLGFHFELVVVPLSAASGPAENPTSHA